MRVFTEMRAMIESVLSTVTEGCGFHIGNTVSERIGY
jgi:hypothetical protein